MNILTRLIDELSIVANDQAAIAGDHDNNIEMREAAATHYGTIVLVMHAVARTRDSMLAADLNALEKQLVEAAPPGANPKINTDHPSTQPRLHVVKGDDDDN